MEASPGQSNKKLLIKKSSLQVNPSSENVSQNQEYESTSKNDKQKRGILSNFNRQNKRQQTLPVNSREKKQESLAISLLKKQTMIQNINNQDNNTEQNLIKRTEKSKLLLEQINQSRILLSEQSDTPLNNKSPPNNQNNFKKNPKSSLKIIDNSKTQIIKEIVSNSNLGGSQSEFRSEMNFKSKTNINNKQQQQNNNKSRLFLRQQFFNQQCYVPEKNYHYYGGHCNYNTIVKVRGISYQESQLNDYQPIDILDHQNIVFKLQEDGIQASKRKLQQLTREKVMTFDQVYSESDSNEQLYKHSFNKMVKQFLNGQNQSIFIHGGEKSGKQHTTFGTLRDPGLMTTILRDLFNEVYEMPQCDDIILKMTFLNYDSESGQFYDLLVNTEQPLKIIEDSLSDIHMLGASECIFNNLKTALKLYKTALVNLLGVYQGSDQEKEILSKSNFICLIKAELPPKDNLTTDTIISKLKLVKFSSQEFNPNDKRQQMNFIQKDDNTEQKEYNVSIAVSKLLKLLSDQQYKTKKNTYIPYKMNPLMESLIDSFQGNSKTHIIICVNNIGKYSLETNQYLRDAIHSKNINTNPYPLKISFAQQNLQYGEIKEEVRKTLYLWLMEFGHQDNDDRKRKRQYIIYKQLNKVEIAFQNILPYFESLALLKTQLNLLYSQILQNYCNAFSKLITCENIQEFYLAKLQNYMVLELDSQNSQQVQFCKMLIDEINENKCKILLGLRQLHKALRIWENKEKKPQYINNYDVEKFLSIGKFCRKWLETLELFANYNHYNASRFNQDFIQIFQKTKQIFLELQADNDNANLSNLNDNTYIQNTLQTLESSPNLDYNSKPSMNSFQEQENESDERDLNNNNQNQNQNQNINNNNLQSISPLRTKGYSTMNNLDDNIKNDNNNNLIKNIDFHPQNQELSPSQKKIKSQTKEKENKDRLERLKERFFLTEQEKLQKKKNEEHSQQEYFYCKNQKIRTGKFQFKSIKKLKKQQQNTQSTENSMEVDDDLIKNLFVNEVLRMQYSSSQQVKSRKQKQEILKFSQTSNHYYNKNKQKKLNKSPSNSSNQKQQIFNQIFPNNNPQNLNQQYFSLQSSGNPKNNQNNNQRYTNNLLNSRQDSLKNSPTLLLQQSSQNNNNRHSSPQNSPHNNYYFSLPHNQQNSLHKYQSQQQQESNNNNENSFSYQRFSKKQRKAIAQQKLDEIKNSRLSKAKSLNLPKVTGLDKFKFTLPKLEDKNDYQLCNRFSIQ